MKMMNLIGMMADVFGDKKYWLLSHSIGKPYPCTLAVTICIVGTIRIQLIALCPLSPLRETLKRSKQQV